MSSVLSQMPGGEAIGCFGKVSYASPAAASKAVRHMPKKRKWKGTKVAHYHCTFCGAWHVGTRSWGFTS